MGPEEAADRVELDHLVRTYADVVTRGAWPELDPLFAPGATITVDVRTRDAVDLHGAAALGRFIADAVARFELFEVALLNSVVSELGGGAAEGRVYTLEVRRAAADGEWSGAYGLYRDRYRHDGDRWRFAQRHYQSLARVVAPEGTVAETFPLLTKPLASSPSDPSGESGR